MKSCKSHTAIIREEIFRRVTLTCGLGDFKQSDEEIEKTGLLARHNRSISAP